jgi:hypothetical protein
MKQVFDAIACEAVESPSCGWFNIRQMPHNCGLLFSSYRVTTHLNCLVCPWPPNWSLNSAAPRRGSLIFSAYKWDSNSLISVPKWGSYISCCDEREGGHFVSPWSQHSVPNSLRSSPVWCPKLDCQLKALLTQTLQNVGGIINSTFYLGNLFKSLDNQECTLFFLGVHFTGWGWSTLLCKSTIFLLEVWVRPNAPGLQVFNSRMGRKRRIQVNHWCRLGSAHKFFEDCGGITLSLYICPQFSLIDLLWFFIQTSFAFLWKLDFSSSHLYMASPLFCKIFSMKCASTFLCQWVIQLVFIHLMDLQDFRSE